MLIPLLTFKLLVGSALAGVTLNPLAPPTLVPGSKTVYRFGPDAEWAVLPAVVLKLAPGAAPPSGALPLGGPYWRLPSEDPVGDGLALLDYPGVLDAFPDVLLSPTRRTVTFEAVEFDDPEYGGQWYLERLGAEALFELSLGDPATMAAVIDSGIDISHVDLASAVVSPYDALDEDEDPSPNPGEYCTSGSGICDEHGTAVSGIVAARANNGAGIVGLCPECSLVPIKMLGEPDGGLSASVRAFEHAIEADAAVINNSWGYTSPTHVPALLQDVIERAATEPRGGLGALVIFAAGNDDRELGDDEVEALPQVLCVSAVDSYGYPTAYTNYGDAVAVAAPSATVSIAPGDEVTETFGGTSAAAPVVSGLAAWAASLDPNLSAAELRALIIASAVPSPLVTPDEDGHHPIYGYGVVSAEALLEAMYGGGADTDTGAFVDGGDKGGCACAQSGPRRSSPLFGLALALLVLRRRGAPPPGCDERRSGRGAPRPARADIYRPSCTSSRRGL